MIRYSPSTGPLENLIVDLNALIVDGERGPLPNAVQILYISPLKALNNDVQRNLERLNRRPCGRKAGCEARHLTGHRHVPFEMDRRN